MTDSESSDIDGRSRRSFIKEGALASGAVALGLGSAGSSVAQQTGTETDNGTATGAGTGNDGFLDRSFKGLVFRENFRPFAHFTFVSGVTEWTPNWPDVRDSAWSDYNTYQIRWLDTGNVNPLFVTQEASEEIGQYDSDLGFIPDVDGDSNQPQVWEMNQEFAPLGDNEAIMSVNFSPVTEEEEDNLLDGEGWWQDDGNGNSGISGFEDPDVSS